jgi:hypothetical protein
MRQYVRIITVGQYNVSANYDSSFITLINAPSTLTHNNITNTGADISWNSVSGAVNYKLEISTQPNFSILEQDITTATTSRTITGLNGGTSFYYRVKTIGQDISSSYIFSISNNKFETVILPPATTTETEESDGIRVEWSSSLGALTYAIETSTDNISFGNRQTTTNTYYKYVTSNIGYATKFYYRIAAISVASTYSAWSTTDYFITQMQSPTVYVYNSDITNVSAILTLTSTSINRLSAIEYQISRVSNFSSQIDASGTFTADTSGSLLVNGLTSLITYYIRYRSIGNNFYGETIPKSAWSTNGTSSFMTKTDTPAGLNTIRLGQYNIRLGWTQSYPGAIEYRIQYSTQNDFTGSIFVPTPVSIDVSGDVSSYDLTNFNIQSVTPSVGRAYYFRVGSLFADGYSYSGSSTFYIQLDTPTITSVSSTKNSITVNFETLSGVNTYFYQLASSDTFSGGSIITSGSVASNITTVTMTGLTQNTTYYYRMRGNDATGNGNSEFTTTETITTYYASPSSITVSNITKNSVDISWNTVSGISRYYIQVSTDTSFNNLIVDTSSNLSSYTVSGLIQNTAYYYRISSVDPITNAIVEWNDNNLTATTTLYDTPSSITISNITKNSVDLSWNSIIGISRYYIQIATNSSFTSPIIDTSSNLTTYTASGLNYNTEYYYRVSSVHPLNNSIVEWFNDSLNTFTTLYTSPSSITIKNITKNSADISWNQIIGISTYYIEISTDSSFNTMIIDTTVNGLTYNIINLIPNTYYYYRVSSQHPLTLETVEWFDNNLSTIRTLYSSPTTITASGITDVSANISWTAQKDVSSYKIQISLTSNFAVNTEYTTNETSYVLSGLSRHTLYNVRVSSINPDDNSIVGWTTRTIRTIFEAPTLTSYILNRSIDLSWNLTIDNTSYQLQISTNNFTTILTSATVATNNYTFNNLEGEQTYQIRIRGFIGSLAGLWREYSYTTLADYPTNIDSSGSTDNGFSVSWEDAVVPNLAPPSSYVLEYSVINDFEVNTEAVQTITLTDRNVDLSGLMASTTYYFRVGADYTAYLSFSQVLSISTTFNLLPPTTYKKNQEIRTKYPPGYLITWGNSAAGGNISSEISGNIVRVFSSATAFIGLKADNSIIGWGNAETGGDPFGTSSGNINRINEIEVYDIKNIYSTASAFALLRNDGTVVCWGDRRYGGSKRIYNVSTDTYTDVSNSLINIREIYATESAFVGLRYDRTIITWGSSNGGGSLSNMISRRDSIIGIYSNVGAFTALYNDGQIASWGNASYGGGVFGLISNNRNFIAISNTDYAFAGIRSDGSVATWGNYTQGGSMGDRANDLSRNVVKIFGNKVAFAAIRRNGSVITWGNSFGGGDSSDVSNNLTSNILEIYHTDYAFCGLKLDGTLVVWGNSDYGGNLTQNITNVVNIYATSGAFLALKSDKTAVVWGDSEYGGDATGKTLTNIKAVFGNSYAFTVVKEDGTIETLGNSLSGGDSSNVSGNLVNIEKLYYNNEAFAALKIVDFNINNFVENIDKYNYLKNLSKTKRSEIIEEIYFDWNTLKEANPEIQETLSDFKMLVPTETGNVSANINTNFVIPTIESESVTINNEITLVNYDGIIYKLDNTELIQVTTVIIGGSTFTVYAGSIVFFNFETSIIPCLTPETDILTPYGYVNIQKMKIGDKIMTDKNKIVRIKNIYRFTVEGNDKTYPYIIPAGSIAENYPPKEVRLSGDHLIKFRNRWWIKPRTGCYVLRFEQDKSKKEVIYYHIELPNYFTDHLVINGGCIVESYAGRENNVRLKVNKNTGLYKIKKYNKNIYNDE